MGEKEREEREVREQPNEKEVYEQLELTNEGRLRDITTVYASYMPK